MKKILTYIGIILVASAIFFLQFKYSRSIQPYSLYQVYLDDKVLGVIESQKKLENYIENQGKLIKEQIKKYQDQLETLTNFETIVDRVISNDRDYYDTLQRLKSLKNFYQQLSNIVQKDGTFLSEDRKQIEDIINDEISINMDDIDINKNKIKNYPLLVNRLNEEIGLLNKQILDYINSTKEELDLTDTEEYYLEQYTNEKGYEVAYNNQYDMQKYINENEVYTYSSDIYAPLGIKIEKINTYTKKIDDTKEIYNQIIDAKPCTIEGYQFKLRKENSHNLNVSATIGILSPTNYEDVRTYNANDVIIYVTDPQIFNDAIEKMAEVFVGSDEYEAYKNNTQEEINETGTIIDNIYVEEDITYKKVNISIKEKIYNDADELSSYLLYGDDMQITTAQASSTDTVTSLAYNNGITVEEFFLFNKDFTSINNIFFDGQEVTIAKLNPQLNLVVEEYDISDKTTAYDTVEKYDESLTVGSSVVTQEGADGVERVSQNVKKINGTIVYVDPVSKETIKSPTSEIITVGTKVVPNVGSTSSWGWPTASGYTLSSYFGYRSQVFGEGDFHSGIDIAGTGYNSPVYATNNGVIVTMTKTYSYGNYIMINHNNGYYTLYAHMNGFVNGLSVGSVVSRGQQIGYVGASGWATGPHLHYEIRVCEKYACITNPLQYYR